VYHFNLVQALPTLVIGLVIGFTVYYTNSILSGIIIHILNNSIAIILSNVLPEDLVLLPVHNIMTIIIAGIILIVTLTKLNKSKVEFQTIEQPLLEAV
jgi:membrane protease YdiL (CAAX protease family)